MSTSKESIEQSVKEMNERRADLDERFPCRGAAAGKPSNVTVGDFIKALQQCPPDADLVLCNMNAGTRIPLANIDIEGLRLEGNGRSFRSEASGDVNTVSIGFWNESYLTIEEAA
jgi:hypothetical protein